MKVYEVKQHDSHKLRAIVSLLENHASYKNLSLQQIEALKDVITFIKDLPNQFDKAQEVKPALSSISDSELKAEAKLRGFIISKEA